MLYAQTTGERRERGFYQRGCCQSPGSDGGKEGGETQLVENIWNKPLTGSVDRLNMGSQRKRGLQIVSKAPCIGSDAVQPREVRGWLVDLAFGANLMSTLKETRKKKCKPSFSATGNGYEDVAVAINLNDKHVEEARAERGEEPDF